MTLIQVVCFSPIHPHLPTFAVTHRLNWLAIVETHSFTPDFCGLHTKFPPPIFIPQLVINAKQPTRTSCSCSAHLKHSLHTTSLPHSRFAKSSKVKSRLQRTSFASITPPTAILALIVLALYLYQEFFRLTHPILRDHHLDRRAILSLGTRSAPFLERCISILLRLVRSQPPTDFNRLTGLPTPVHPIFTADNPTPPSRSLAIIRSPELTNARLQHQTFQPSVQFRNHQPA